MKKRILLIILSIAVCGSSFAMKRTRRGAPTTPAKITAARRKGKSVLTRMKRRGVSLQQLHELAQDVQSQIDYLKAVARPQFASELEIELMKILQPRVYTRGQAPKQNTALMIEDLRLRIEGPPGPSPTPSRPRPELPGPAKPTKPAEKPELPEEGPAPTTATGLLWRLEGRSGNPPSEFPEGGTHLLPTKEVPAPMLQKAQAAERAWARNLLGVGANASNREIKTAFQKLSLKYASDRYAQNISSGKLPSYVTQNQVGQIQRLINRAYGFLS